jgi:hypothetical protein
MRTINLADVSPKRRYTADPKYPMCSNWVIDRLIELIENGETFTDNTLCVVDSKNYCVVSRFKESFSKEVLDIEFEQAVERGEYTSQTEEWVDVEAMEAEIIAKYGEAEIVTEVIK